MGTHDQLRSVPLFAGLDEAGLAHVAALATEFEAPAGLVLIDYGQAGTGLFVIEEGEVRIEPPDGGHVMRGPGEFVGELAVLADTGRTARVSAATHIKALAIRRTDLDELMMDEPAIAVAMVRELARRLLERT